MIADVVRPDELGASDLAEWRRVQQGHEALDNAFLAPEFAQAVAAIRPSARVAVLREGAATGFLPFEQHRLGLARAIGIGMSDCQGIVHPPALALDGQDLLRACDLRLWRFDHLVGHQAASLAPEAEHVSSPEIVLDRGFEAYLADRRTASKSLVSTAERKARKLAREVGELRWEPDATDHALVERLVAWKREQYRRTEVKDVLADPSTSTFLHDLLDTRGDAYAGLLSVLYAGDRPVAAHLGPRTPTTLSWWLPAYDHELARYSPGITLLLRLAEWGSSHGVRRIDLGRGDESYKDRFSSGEAHVADGILARPHVGRSYRALRAARGMARQLRSRRRDAAAQGGRSADGDQRLGEPADALPDDAALGEVVRELPRRE